MTALPQSMLSQAADLAESGEPFALATVVWRKGPSSGQQGSHAIITTRGELRGWIGGACAEPAVIREGQQAIADGRSRLLLLGAPDQFGTAIAEGMTVVPISCQSEGALEVYIEPVLPVPHLVIVGGSPMTRTLRSLAATLGWNAELVSGADEFTTGPSAFIVVATQGHGDEEITERAVAARPAYLGLVASRKRGEAVLGYLADRGVPQADLDRVRVPAGLDLGKTTHEEMAVAILAELVKSKSDYPERMVATASYPVGATTPGHPATATDPVCGMTVTPGESAHPLTQDGVTYYFCCAGCRRAFVEGTAEESIVGDTK